MYYVLKKYGIVPNSVMPGLNYGTDRHMHGELVAGLKGYVDGIRKNPNRKLSTAWIPGLKGIWRHTLVLFLRHSNTKAKIHSKSYMESLGLNLDDYVDLVAWTHLPYYEKHPVEVGDNWRWESAYNLPLDELMEVLFYAIENGYTFAWASDVSETGFTRNGIGIVPDMDAIRKKTEEVGSDQAHWVGSDPGTGRPTFNAPVPELEITPELRQRGYEEKTTTDDHGMYIFGLARIERHKLFPDEKLMGY